MFLTLLKLVSPRAIGIVALILLVIVGLSVSYRDGERHERARWTARIAVESAKNARKSATLATVATSIGKKVEDDQDQRAKTVLVYRDRIVHDAAIPECSVDDGVLNDVNAVRNDSRVAP